MSKSLLKRSPIFVWFSSQSFAVFIFVGDGALFWGEGVVCGTFLCGFLQVPWGFDKFNPSSWFWGFKKIYKFHESLMGPTRARELVGKPSDALS